MATVHRARDTQLERAVAVKLMRPDLAEDPIFEARFVNEARNAAAISHPNVVTVLDFGVDGPGPYLVMELVEGGDLASLIAREGPLSPQRAASIAAEVASALQAAHGKSIVHRDVKPANILLAKDGHPRVADFGIARATGEQSLTGTGTSLGSVDYFSPEQARGEPATAASDIYALGVVLHEMLTGARPFSGDTPYAIAVARVEAPPPDPRAIRPDIPKPLAAVVQRAMATDPIARFASAAEMGRRLDTWLTRNPVPDADPAPASAVAAAPAKPARKAAPRKSAPRKKSAAVIAAAAAAAAATQAAPVAAAAAPAGPADTMPVVAAVPPAAEPVPATPDRPRRRSPLLLVAAAIVLLAVIGFAGGRLIGDGNDGGMIVGEPRGEVFASTPEPTEQPTGRPTPVPPESATPEPTLVSTPVPVAVVTPPPATPVPPRATPAPTPIAVAMAVTPDQTVATWYSYVEDGEFDAAYALWSNRMKANFERQGNLDNRWRHTADVTFTQLYVTEQTQTTAKVHVDFIETMDDGASRRIIGWWDLVRSGDGWLLDHPNF